MSKQRPSGDADELGRRLGQAFDAKARASFPDHRPPPPMRMADPVRTRQLHRHPARWLAPLATAAAVLVVVALVFGLTQRSGPHHRPGQLGSPARPAPTGTAGATPVHVSLKLHTGTRVGVGLPIVAYLSRPIGDARRFAEATRVTVNGRPVRGGWYFQRTSHDGAHPIRADYRLPALWPAHSKIHMSLPVKGLSAGPGLVFDDSLSLDFDTGAANIVTVDAATHRLSLVSDGRPRGSFLVSLGAQRTPTRRGTKVIMAKGDSICLTGPGFHECNLRYTQQLTDDGEYLLASPAAAPAMGSGIDAGNGATNLALTDAKKLYDVLEIGDVVEYPDADGPLMQLGDGYGDWNVPWVRWRSGGLYRVR
jgi:lipoprotein-anchoring transpeptidase ErfK/SrfK